MYIVWQKQSLAHDYYRDIDRHERLRRDVLSASLSMSKRVEGKPRRIHVATLGHIEEARLDCPSDRAAFWYRAGRVLAEHAPEQFKELRGKLLERVPEISQDELQTAEVFMDLIVQDAEAARFWAKGIHDGRLRRRMTTTAEYVDEHQKARAEFDSWWQHQTSIFERRRRDHLDRYAQEHDIEIKPFDYSEMDQETREHLERSAAAIKRAMR